MKKILISGAAGFIGSHLCDLFLKEKYNVIGLDNLITGKIDNIKHNLENENFTFFEHDICHEFKTKDKIDYVLHFASPASPKDYLKYPLETLKVGSAGTENMLNLALKNHSTILVASTSEVYGDPLVNPQPETYFGNVNPVGLRSVYDESKRFLEAITNAYRQKNKLNVRIARIFNTYGPRMRIDDGRVIPNFINQALNDKNFSIYGNGNQTRSFCYIDDTIDALHKLLFSNFQLPINIGNPVEISIINLGKKINLILNKNSKFIYSNLPENDPKVRRPDITLANKILKWNPEVDLETGLKMTANYYKNLFNFIK